MITSIKKNSRGLFYGFFVSIGLVFLTQVTIDSGPRTFFLGSVILYFLFIVEIYTNWQFARRVLSQMEIPQVDTYSTYGQITHHFLLPTLLYISYLGIIYFYHLTIPKYFLFLFAFFVFSTLFINIRAYYEDKFKIEERTHYVYDIIKFVLFFQMTTTIMQLKVIFSLDELFVPVSLFILSLAISVVVTIRQRQFNIATILFNIVTSALIAFGSHLLLTYTGFTLLAVSAYTLLLFYIFNAILHHRLEGSLSKEILLEYLTLLLLGLVLLQGLF